MSRGNGNVVSVHQTVGYKRDTKDLVVTMTSKMANAMKKDGWDVGFNSELGHFITIRYKEE